MTAKFPCQKFVAICWKIKLFAPPSFPPFLAYNVAGYCYRTKFYWERVLREWCSLLSARVYRFVRFVVSRTWVLQSIHTKTQSVL